jgi:hypothetical protein
MGGVIVPNTFRTLSKPSPNVGIHDLNPDGCRGYPGSLYRYVNCRIHRPGYLTSFHRKGMLPMSTGTNPAVSTADEATTCSNRFHSLNLFDNGWIEQRGCITDIFQIVGCNLSQYPSHDFA